MTSLNMRNNVNFNVGRITFRWSFHFSTKAQSFSAWPESFFIIIHIGSRFIITLIKGLLDMPKIDVLSKFLYVLHFFTWKKTINKEKKKTIQDVSYLYNILFSQRHHTLLIICCNVFWFFMMLHHFYIILIFAFY